MCIALKANVCLPPSDLLSDLEDSLGLRVLGWSHDGCRVAGCPPPGCRNAVRLMGEQLSHFSSARVACITPRHRWESVCSCNGKWAEASGRDQGREGFRASGPQGFWSRLAEDPEKFGAKLEKL